MNFIDLYCERIGAEFWAEPINAMTNLSFIIAAWATWRKSDRPMSITSGASWLIIIAVAIGIGSFVFHTMATTWARVLDVLPILAFQLLFLWMYLRSATTLSRTVAGSFLAVFLIAAYLGRQFPETLNGSLIYGPAIITILLLGIHQAVIANVGRFDLLIAAGVFTASLFFRLVDNSVCPAFPIGTHFLWHVLNGVVVYLAMRTLIRPPARH